MSKPVTMIEAETPDHGLAVYFSMQEHTAREWLGLVARYETGTFPAGTQFVSAVVLGRFTNEQIANKFIAGQIAVFEEAGKLVLNSYKPVKSRPVLELVET
jgi:hypothetical protein